MIDEYGFKIYDTGDGRNGGALRTNANSNDLRTFSLNKHQRGQCLHGQRFCRFLPYKGLKLTLNASVSLDETRGTRFRIPGTDSSPKAAPFSKGTVGIAYNMQQFLTYTNTFADVHNLDLLLGHEMYNRKSYGCTAPRP